MARDFHDAYAESRMVFENASDALGVDVAELCFEGGDRLGLTEFQQPAILTAEIAMLAALRAHFGFEPTHFGGHSLGEYAALVAAGVMDIGPTARLVRERGRLMQEAVPVGDGAMTAVIQPDLDVERLSALLDGLEADVANHNSPDQAVVSGRAIDVATVAERLRADAAFARARCIPLRVSAPFHSRLMGDVETRFRPSLDEAAGAWRAERAASVVSNALGTFHHAERNALVDALARQITAPVRWLDCMRALVARTERIVEVGPGRPLAGFFKGVGAAVTSVSNVAAAERLSAS